MYFYTVTHPVFIIDGEFYIHLDMWRFLNGWSSIFFKWQTNVVHLFRSRPLYRVKVDNNLMAVCCPTWVNYWSLDLEEVDLDRMDEDGFVWSTTGRVPSHQIEIKLTSIRLSTFAHLFEFSFLKNKSNQMAAARWAEVDSPQEAHEQIRTQFWVGSIRGPVQLHFI